MPDPKTWRPSIGTRIPRTVGWRLKRAHPALFCSAFAAGFNHQCFKSIAMYFTGKGAV